jgi:putative RNA 2'-phosphotransferase
MLRMCRDESKFLMSSYELESLGRILALILRHAPDRFGLEMDEEGFIDLYKIVTAIKKKKGDTMRWLRPTHIIGLVETDPKGRYQVEDNNVRATYGHSIPLKMSLPTDGIPERLFYPAKPDEVEKFMSEGIHPVDRTMVHLSKTWNDAFEAGIHKEGPEPIILRIDAELALNNGIIIQRAGKTVFTVEEVPHDFVSISDDVDKENSRKELEERARTMPGYEASLKSEDVSSAKKKGRAPKKDEKKDKDDDAEEVGDEDLEEDIEDDSDDDADFENEDDDSEVTDDDEDDDEEDDAVEEG